MTSFINVAQIVNHQLRELMVLDGWIIGLTQNLQTNCLSLGCLSDSLSSSDCKWIKARSKVVQYGGKTRRRTGNPTFVMWSGCASGDRVDRLLIAGFDVERIEK